MSIYDISLPLSEALVVWPGDPPLCITQEQLAWGLDKIDQALTLVDEYLATL